MNRPYKKHASWQLSCIALALCASLSQQAIAADSKERYAIKGAGVMTCQSFLEERIAGSPRYYAAIGWLQGYLTGFNRFTDGVYDILPWQNLKVLAASMDSHCQKNPTQPLFLATRLMARAYKPHAITEQSKLVEARSGDKGYLIYQETLRRVQANLKQQGFLAQKPDGIFNPATKAAIQAFQEKHQLNNDGLPNEQTLYTILEKTTGSQ